MSGENTIIGLENAFWQVRSLAKPLLEKAFGNVFLI